MFSSPIRPDIESISLNSIRHPAGNPTGDSETSSTMIAHTTVTYLGVETMLHMTCLGSKQETIIQNLEKAKSLGKSLILKCTFNLSINKLIN